MKKYLRSFPDFYLLNKNVFKSNIGLFLVLLLVFIIVDYRVLNIDLLNAYDVDEFYFLKNLYSRQYQGFNHLNAQRFFSGFYSYGRLFWITNFIVTYVPFTFGKYNLALFLTRLTSSLFLIQGMLIFKETLAKIGYQRLSIIAVCGIGLLMSYFWAIGSWLHPDGMMIYLVLLAFYYFFDTSFNKDRAPINFLMALAIAIAVKVQTLQLMPLLLLYNCRDFVIAPSWASFISSARKCVMSGVIILVIFIILNPYLLHPLGLALFYESFAKDMASNKTNYWSGHIPVFAEKIASFNEAYLSIGVIAVAIIAAIVFSYNNIRNYKRNFEKFAFLISLLVMIVYYSLWVNKTWPHYYIPIAFMMLIVLYFTFDSFKLTNSVKIATLGIVLLIQGLNFYQHLDFFKSWIYPEKALAENGSFILKDSLVKFFAKHPDSKNAAILFTFKLPIPVTGANLNFAKVSFLETFDEKQQLQVSRMDRYPPDYLIIQKSMFYDRSHKAEKPQYVETVARLDAIKVNRVSAFRLVDSDEVFLYIKRNQ